MAESEDLASRIEKLIVDGNKEVLEKVEKVETNLGRQIQDLKQDVQHLDKKIDAVHVSLKQEISVTAGILDFDIKEVSKKLDEHMRMPAHVAV